MKRLPPLFCIAVIISCNSDSDQPSPQDIESIALKKGEVIWCGPPTGDFGVVQFAVTASGDARKDFDQAVAMLHSFEYIEAEKAFAKVIDKDPSCAMAYWGVAMSNYHPLWEPPKPDELTKGSRAIEIAQSLKNKSKREAEYIDAIAAFYKDWQTVDHKTRSRNYERAMNKIYNDYPKDDEAAIFYALALNATADPTDKSYSNQRKAGEILDKVHSKHPDHPGIIHYIIHNYDNPDLAQIALPAARKYASVAPASAHAQHMPSHIFIRLGLWDEAISSNIASVNSAKCYAEKADLAGNFDEELHGLDYLMYSYLQKGDNKAAEDQLNYIGTVKSVSAQNLKVAYAYAAMPVRYVLENRKWKEAASLQLFPSNFPWDKFPWQSGIVTYARLLGKVHNKDLAGAELELNHLKQLQQKLLDRKDQYYAKQLEVQIKSGDAWIQLRKGNKTRALELMNEAADIEDGTTKHPVTPGEVLPARELLGDMYMEVNQYANALKAYEADLKMHVNRFNGLYGAAVAAQKTGDQQKSRDYYNQLMSIAAPGSNRAELRSLAVLR